MRYFYIFLILPQFLLAQQQIVYLSNQSGNFDLFCINQDGSNSRQLTTNPGWDWAPRWNTTLDGLLYNSNDTAGQFSIQAIKADGAPLDFDDQKIEDSNLSPDGSQVLYTLKDKQNNYIGIYNRKDQSNRLLVMSEGYNGRPSWSPDGKSFSFLSDRSGNTEIYLYQFANKKIKQLTQSPKREKYTSWMPDGKSIVYTYHYSDERDQEHNDIFIVNIKNKKTTQITKDDHFYQEIAVSPDGQKIAFHGKRDGQHHIYTIDIDGTHEKQITSVDAYHGEPCWVPYFE